MTAPAARRVAAVAVAAAAAWIALPGQPWPVRAMVVVLLVVLPTLLVLQARVLEDVALDDLPRGSIYLHSAGTLWLLAGLVAAAAWLGDAGSLLALRWIGWLPTLAWGAALTLGALLLMAAARTAGVQEAAALVHLLPRTSGERIAFVGVSVTAGVCEEFVYRGFLLGVLLTVAPWALALALSAGAFGLVHAYQQPAGALRAAALGLLLAAPVLVHGSLWPAVIAHAAIDVVLGIVLRDKFVR